MIVVEKKYVIKDNESCNFCDKGELNETGYGLKYPYQYVYLFKREGSGLQASICDECLKELNEKALKFGRK